MQRWLASGNEAVGIEWLRPQVDYLRRDRNGVDSPDKTRHLPAEQAAPDSTPPPGPYLPALHAAPGQMVMLESGRITAFVIASGQRVLIGRGPGADLVIYDARVSPIHALIERRGPGWLVTGLDANNPTWILDPTGRPHPVSSELGLRSGTLLVGGCQVLLYPPRTGA
jgi:hypothetical protein